MDQMWEVVDRQIEEQKFEAAYETAREILRAAQSTGNSEEWVRSLIRCVQLRTALHGYETAVRFLTEESWPSDPAERTILHLFYAQSLTNYYSSYAYEILQREEVVADDEVDLKRWTRDQLLAAAQASYLNSWQQREQWKSDPVGSLSEFVTPNSYPKQVRGTLRDTVTYLWVELLANTQWWTPSQSNDKFQLSREDLIVADASNLGHVPLASPETHPLLQIAVALADLEAWHLREGRPSAAFEARRERLERVHSSLDGSSDRAAIRRALGEALDKLGEDQFWWSAGMATLAEMTRHLPEPDALIRARAIAQRGAVKDPSSIGAQRCQHIVASIEAPSYGLQSMTLDGLDRRSIQVDHANLDRLHFRAYPVDLKHRLRTSKDYNLLPQHAEIQKLIQATPVAFSWSVDLPETPDFRTHRTFVTPEITEPGLYTIVASARSNFSGARNSKMAVNLLVSDLVLLSRNVEDRVEVTARSGKSGFPIANVDVYLYRFDWQKGHKSVLRGRTDGHGRLDFKLPNRQQHFLFAEYQKNQSLDSNYLHNLGSYRLGPTSSTLVFTDRSVYRPNQTLHWKVVPFKGGGESGNYKTQPDRKFTVTLRDANAEEVASQEVMTNEFGTVSGEFEIPSGRLLGAWSIQTSLSGSASIRIEEYKRPTFEVELSDPTMDLRLNEPVTLEGNARYYFGLPVSGGDVSWQVTREPVYPYWWYWAPPVQRQTISAGSSAIDVDGRFEVTFTPEAEDLGADSEGVSYNYRLSAEVTDDGGETRSTQRVFRLGFVAVKATPSNVDSFQVSGEPGEVTILRTDLDGRPKAGKGQWRLHRLVTPEQAQMPTDQPVIESDSAGYKTNGDRLQPRWIPHFDPQRLLSSWDIQETPVTSGSLDHGADGAATVPLGASLASGAYRLVYTTRDSAGAIAKARYDLLVVEEGMTSLPLPALLLTQQGSVEVGQTARVLAYSGLRHQEVTVDSYRRHRRVRRRTLNTADGLQILEIPIDRKDRGGYGFSLSLLSDHQLINLGQNLFVPWSDRELQLEFSTFRDRLRPGTSETWTVTVRSDQEKLLTEGASEVLAYMYDRSLDLFAPHTPPSVLALYPNLYGFGFPRANLGIGSTVWWQGSGLSEIPHYPQLRGDSLVSFGSYGIGGMGFRYDQRNVAMSPSIMMVAESEAVEGSFVAARKSKAAAPPAIAAEMKADQFDEASGPETDQPTPEVRSNFSETAFWEPHLLSGKDGTVSFQFTVPDSVTEWNVWVHGITQDLRGGSTVVQTRTVKELLVRPYLPRFLREGDLAEVSVQVNNAGESSLDGSLNIELFDPSQGDEQSGPDLAAAFGLSEKEISNLPFSIEPGRQQTLTFPLRVPTRVGPIAFRIVGQAGDYSDGELRSLPVLPSRMHLVQSRFTTLKDAQSQQITFPDLARSDDPSLEHDQLVVTIDGQLFYQVLESLPYLIDYPYECMEQTLNRFLSSGIVSSVFDEYPGVAAMAKEMSQRDTQLPTWENEDPNRKMALVETPWLRQSRGNDYDLDLVKVLDPRVARTNRKSALRKLRKSQTSLGAFPWWPGGPPSPYMTLYMLHGFSRALEFDVEVPKDVVQRAWGYMHRHYLDELVQNMIDRECCWETVTFLNYVLSSYPDDSWTGGVFTTAERKSMLEFSFKHWKQHSPLLKGMLTLTLERADRHEDALLVFDSVMDSAKSNEKDGTFWAPEDRAWLWYNDTIETHAFALRVLGELSPDDERRHGLVQWLLINKKLGHWKSTRATAEVIYSMVHYLEDEGSLGVREAVRVDLADESREFVFEPDVYTGKNNQWVIPGDEVVPAMSTIDLSKETPGFLFASATWHFSTEKLPEAASGDLFQVERSYFHRVHDGKQWTLVPISENTDLEPGDQVEVHLSIRSRHAAEYVHLRDPRGAGFEPETIRSGYHWDLGINWYEEVRDSGTNFFFEWLPAGEYTFKYRLRANMAGTFRVGPATLQSMYAPEFAAYSSGKILEIQGQ